MMMILRDIKGRRWICGDALRTVFGIHEVGRHHFWNYDYLLRLSFRKGVNKYGYANQRRSF